MRSIKVKHFPGLTALPLYVAAAKGHFAAQDLAISLEPATNSRELMVGILKGEFEIGQAAIDNLIAYQEMQAAPELEYERDLIGIMTTSSTNLDLIVRPEIMSYASLRNKTLAVDAVTTGFAFVLQKMLETGGLNQSDYNLSAVGGDSARLTALKNGQVAGALLAKDYAKQAISAGLCRLGKSLDVLKKYQGTSLFVRQSWASEYHDELVRFIRAVRNAHDWIFEDSNVSDAAVIYSKQVSGVSPADTVSLIRRLTNSAGELSRDGVFDLDAVEVVLSLRRQYGVPKRNLGPASRYVTSSYLTLSRDSPAQ